MPATATCAQADPATATRQTWCLGNPLTWNCPLGPALIQTRNSTGGVDSFVGG